jgi:hypothetical protein
MSVNRTGALSRTSVSNTLRLAVWRVATSRRKIRIATGPLTRAGTPAAYSPVSNDQAVRGGGDQDEPVSGG